MVVVLRWGPVGGAGGFRTIAQHMEAQIPISPGMWKRKRGEQCGAFLQNTGPWIPMADAPPTASRTCSALTPEKTGKTTGTAPKTACT